MTRFYSMGDRMPFCGYPFTVVVLVFSFMITCRTLCVSILVIPSLGDRSMLCLFKAVQVLVNVVLTPSMLMKTASAKHL